MENVGWLTIREMYTLHSCVFLWKILHLRKPGHLAERFITDENLKIGTSRTRLQFTDNGFRWKTSLIWNQLSEEMRKETSVTKGCCKIKKSGLTLDFFQSSHDPPPTTLDPLGALFRSTFFTLIVITQHAVRVH